MKGCSGGMRRRLDLATSLVTRPPVLFLDEPTTGLDPTSHVRMWQVIRQLVADGTTLLLTTQYLEEVDELADRIVVVDHGTVIAEGSPAELKAQTGGALLAVTLAKAHPLAAGALAPLVDGPVQVSQDGRRLRAAVPSTSGVATTIVRALVDAGIGVDDLEVRPPSLDVFFAIAGLILLNLTTSDMGTAVGLISDLTTGAVDRLSTLPMWRFVVLVGRSVADLLSVALCTAIVAVTGLAIGWRPGASLAGFGVALLFAYALFWACACLGIVSKGPESAQGVGLIILFPLAIVSNAMVPAAGMPGWLQAIANWSPVSAITAAVRHLIPQPEPLCRHLGLAHAAPGRGRARLVGGHPPRVRPACRTPVPAEDLEVTRLPDRAGRPPGGPVDLPTR